jgi:DNA-binding response OmpR family regulator
LRLFFDHRPALVITDLRMQGMDGFQLISRIREISDVHILVLTALESEEYLIRGLGLGADEYLVKPTSRRPMLARVRALIRRAAPSKGAPSGYSDASVALNFLTHEAQVSGQVVSMRPTEFRLLAYLCQNHDRVIRHRELLDRV